MAGGLKPDAHVAQRDRLVPAQRLLAEAGVALAQPRPHHRQRVGRRQHGAMARAGVIGVAVGDHRAVHRPQRIDEESARLAEQAVGQDFQPGRGMRHRAYVGSRGGFDQPGH